MVSEIFVSFAWLSRWRVIDFKTYIFEQGSLSSSLQIMSGLPWILMSESSGVVDLNNEWSS